MAKSNVNKLIAMWLNSVLTEGCKGAKVYAIDSSSTILSRLIANLGLERMFPESEAWDLKADVTGIVEGDRKADLALVDYKPRGLTLDDVGELLGYARAIDPMLCILVSPCPLSDSLITLLTDYGRHDVLEYGRQNRHIRLARWHDSREEVIPGSIIPRGRLFYF